MVILLTLVACSPRNIKKGADFVYHSDTANEVQLCLVKYTFELAEFTFEDLQHCLITRIPETLAQDLKNLIVDLGPSFVDEIYGKLGGASTMNLPQEDRLQAVVEAIGYR